jgi:hypothetical protein
MSEPNWKAVGQLGAQLLDLLTSVRETFKTKGVGIEVFAWIEDKGKTAFGIVLHCLAREYLDQRGWAAKAPGLVYKTMLGAMMESALESGNGPEALVGVAEVLQRILHSRFPLADISDNDRHGIECLCWVILHVLNRPTPDYTYVREKLAEGLPVWNLQIKE